jgi:hypothetical protein
MTMAAWAQAILGEESNESLLAKILKLREFSAAGRRAKMPQREMLPIYEAENAIKQEMAARFGRLHGWRYTPSRFPLPCLIKGTRNNGKAHHVPYPWEYFDHRDHFLHRDGGAVAVAAHLYTPSSETMAEAQEWGASQGLVVAQPDFPSWYYPGRTRLVVWTAKSPRPAMIPYQDEHGIDLRQVPRKALGGPVRRCPKAGRAYIGRNLRFNDGVK